jgi:hypothetical protein
LADFFKDLFQSKNLFDIQPENIVPTWRNGRTGTDSIAKRLDRCFISEYLLTSVGLYRSWVEYPFISDHAHVLLQLEIPPLYKAYPFKLNSQWLLEKDYNDLVHKVWKDPKILFEEGRQRRIVWKLKDLKTHTKIWVKERIGRNLLHLEMLETEIKDIILNMVGGASLPEAERHLCNMEQERNKLLKVNEELWRQHSRAIWIQSGDQNTKFFHHYANHRRNQKHVWEISDETGYMHTGQGELKEEAVNYFKFFFKASGHPSTTEQVKVVGLFSRLVNVEEARSLHGPVNLGELKEVLSLFKKDKSPGPDGWTVEFFTHFFDLVGEDLLEMVEESRLKGFIVGSLNSTFLALIPKANKPTTFGDFRPISLCNLCYKLISKIIANRIKPILSRSLSAEQLGFLKGRQIQDVIGTTHECLHSKKKKN